MYSEIAVWSTNLSMRFIRGDATLLFNKLIGNTVHDCLNPGFANEIFLFHKLLVTFDYYWLYETRCLRDVGQMFMFIFRYLQRYKLCLNYYTRLTSNETAFANMSTVMA